MDHEQAYDAILDRLQEGWRVGRSSFDPATRTWGVTAIGPKLGGRRGPPPVSVEGSGADELAALEDLAERLAAGRL